MPTNLGVQSVSYNGDGSINVTFTDGNGRDFTNMAALQSAGGGVVTRDLLESLLLARFRGLNPAMTNPASINGVLVEVDMASVLNPVSFGSA